METERLTKRKIKKYKKKRRKKRIKIKITYFICLIIFFSSILLIGAKLIIGKKPQKINKIAHNKKLDISNFTTYSQCLEDFILYCIFYDIDNGFYIDVGANDPDYISVTKAFYLKGWHGINIEPLPDMFQKLLNYRNKDINLNIGAGEKDDLMPLAVGGGGSTLNKKYFSSNSQTINITVNLCQKYVKCMYQRMKKFNFVKLMLKDMRNMYY